MSLLGQKNSKRGKTLKKFESIVRSHFATLLVLAGLGMVTVKSTEGRSVGQEARVARFTEHLIWSGYTYNWGIGGVIEQI